MEAQELSFPTQQASSKSSHGVVSQVKKCTAQAQLPFKNQKMRKSFGYQWATARLEGIIIWKGSNKKVCV
jgi:hypothetical protein